MDSNEFVERYREHLLAVSKFLARRVPTEAVEDLCSDVFEVAWRKKDSAPAGYELAWLYAIAGNLVANWRRRENTAKTWLHRFAVVSYEPSAEQLALADVSLAQAWSKLRPIDRRILALVVLDDLPVSQAAKTLGISSNAAAVRLNRARNALAELLAVTD